MQVCVIRAGPTESHQKASPATPRSARELKVSGSESDPNSSQSASRTQKASPKAAEKRQPKSPVVERRSPKCLVTELKSPQSPVPERKSPRSPVPELKKRPSRLSELESQISKLQEELKSATVQLSSSESQKKTARKEAEEVKKQLADLTSKLGETENHLVKLSASQEDKLQEVHNISQEREKAWELELESARKQNVVDSAAMETARSEILRLKSELDLIHKSEAARSPEVGEIHNELQNSKLEIVELQSIVENMQVKLKNYEESEVEAHEKVHVTLQKLDEAKMTIETLESDGIKAREAYQSASSELVQTRAQVNSLEEHISKLQADLAIMSNKCPNNPTADEECAEEVTENRPIKSSEEFKVMYNSMNEIGELRIALEAAEVRYQEEQIRNMMQIRSAYEMVEQVKSDASLKEEELKAKLKEKEVAIEELKAHLMDKENELQNILEENEGLCVKVENNSSKRQTELEIELTKSVADLKAALIDKEREMQNLLDENENLKSEVKRREMEFSKVNEEALVEVEAAKAVEKEALIKLGYATDEADRSSRKAERVMEQLEAAQGANSEMDAELRRLKVQSDQWRKAAEAAAAVLSAGQNGKLMERSGSLDSSYNPATGRVYSPYADDMDDDSPKKKNNMLKKIGVMWKKSHK
ncbi:hypothetical protein Syun_001077 [Stephania yunnanensis]|uniref:Interactor of constitutive active ROPs 3 n=1 Tax=Stephania yunnanensis TaxID=152371 RepID=A0AAP0Q5X6_9MAGN